MKIGIDTLGCEHSKSGFGSYLLYFLKNIPADSPYEFELFGSELDRYVYSSEKEKTFVSVKLSDNLKAEQRWHKSKICKFVKKQKYDLIIFPAVENVIAEKKLSAKSIAVMSSIYSNVIRNSRKNKHQIKKGLTNCTLIIAATNFIKQDLINNGFSPDKIQVVYNGIDHKLFFPSIQDESEYVEIKPFAIKRPYFIYGSRLSGQDKKHIELIKAFNLFKKNTNNPHRLVLVGNDGDYSEEIRKEAYNSDYASDIFLTGYFPLESFSRLYAGATACVFPSVNEGIGMPVLEAMACGIPVLCSNGGALTEVGGDVPLYFDSDNIKMIADFMQQIIDDKKLAKEKSEASLSRASLFNWEETVQKTLSLAKNLFN